MKWEIQYFSRNADHCRNAGEIFRLYKHTPLKQMTPEMQQRVVQWIKEGVDVRAYEKGQSRTLLHLVAESGNTEGLTLLFAKDAVITLLFAQDAVLTQGVIVDAQDRHKFTPLHLAARYNHPECVTALLAVGADPHAKTTATTGKKTPLHWAAIGNSLECLPLLQAAGLDIHELDDEGNNLLHLSAQGGADAFLREMLRLGLNPYDENKSRQTPLHSAAECGRVVCMQTLLEVGADMHRRDASGNTALLISCSDLEEIIPLALAAGVNINEQDYDGDTALHRAARISEARSMQALLDAGAYVNIRGFNGNTPLQWLLANKENFSAQERILLDAGASVWNKNKAGEIAGNQEEIQDYVKEWSTALAKNERPETIDDVLHMISVMPVHNNEAIPEPREMIKTLFRTLPHTRRINDLYQECTGQERPLKMAESLQEMRGRVKGRLAEI